MGRLDHHTRSIVWAATTGPQDAQESIEPYPSSGPSRRLTDDDLLLLSIRWVKVVRRDGPNFVTEVASILWTLKAELEEGM